MLAHHGSLSRRIRQGAERRLKSGELRAVVATASLELGIDVGTVDLVCQIGSPRSSRGRPASGWAGPATTVDTPGRLPRAARAALRDHPRRARRVRRPRPRHPAGAARSTGDPGLAARRAGPAAGGRVRVRDVAGRRPVPAGAIRGALRGAAAARVRGGGGHAVRRHRHVAGTCRGVPPPRPGENGTVRGRRGARLAAITGGGAHSRQRQLPGGGRAGPDDGGDRRRRLRGPRASPATSSCWAPPLGASAGWSRAACGSRTPTARRRRCRSGAGRPRGRTPRAVGGGVPPARARNRRDDRRRARHRARR